jgi:hypothetical protein
LWKKQCRLIPCTYYTIIMLSRKAVTFIIHQAKNSLHLDQGRKLQITSQRRKHLCVRTCVLYKSTHFKLPSILFLQVYYKISNSIHCIILCLNIVFFIFSMCVCVCFFFKQQATKSMKYENCVTFNVNFNIFKKSAVHSHYLIKSTTKYTLHRNCVMLSYPHVVCPYLVWL